MDDFCAALKGASAAYVRFVDATNELALAVPTGVLPYSIDWESLGVMLDGTEFPAGVEIVIASQMFRDAGTTESGRRCKLPGARPLTETTRMNPAAIEPATESVRRMHEWLLSEVKDRFDALDQNAKGAQ